MITWFKRMYRDWKWRKRTEWAHVPPPEWAAKRSGREYW
jgi:hypothetical protein